MGVSWVLLFLWVLTASTIKVFSEVGFYVLSDVSIFWLMIRYRGEF